MKKEEEKDRNADGDGGAPGAPGSDESKFLMKAISKGPRHGKHRYVKCSECERLLRSDKLRNHSSKVHKVGAPLGAPNKSENLNSTFVQTDTMKSEEKSIQTDLTMKVVAVFIKGYYDLRQLAGAPGAPAETLKALK